MLTTDPALIRAAIAVERAKAERDNPPTLEDTFAKLKWSPYPKQQAVIDAVMGGTYAVLAGGAAGGGKSALGRNLAIALCRRYAGIRGAIFRRVYPELHRTHELPIQMLPQEFGRYFSDPHEFRFNNGSILELASCERNADLVAFQSAEYEFLVFDESTQLSWEMITFLNARVRSTNPNAPRFILLLTNPGGESHTEVKTTFVDPEEPGTPFRARIGEAEFPAIFIPFLLDDNPALALADPSYRDRIMAMPEYLRRAWLYGDWDVSVGMFFDRFMSHKHVIKPIEIPKSWPRWRAIDYGYRAPACCLWGARDNDGTIYIYREMYQTRLTDREQARVILDLSREDPAVRFTVADPSVFSKQPNGTSIAQAWHNAGLKVIPANNDRKSGWQRVHQMLDWHEDKEPMLKIFSTCRNLIREMGAAQHSKFKPEDLDDSLPEHALDAARYLLHGGSMRGGKVRLMDFSVEESA